MDDVWDVTLGDVSISAVAWLYVEVRPQSSMEEALSDVIQVMVTSVFTGEDSTSDSTATISKAIFPLLALAYTLLRLILSVVLTRQK